jgi:DNA polymerase III epsilon subunit
MVRQVFINIRTSGREPEQGHRVIELAAVEAIEGRISGKTFHRYIKPYRPVDLSAIQAHGITDEFLAEQPEFSEIVEQFLEFANGSEVVIHNTAADVTFVDAELRRVNSGLSDVFTRVVDTLSLATKLHPRKDNSLEALCARYGVVNSPGHIDGALTDALLLAKVYIAGFASLRMDVPHAISSKKAIWTPDMEKELFAYLRRYPASLRELTPRRFEELIAAIFRNNGFSVELTPQSRDGGVDIIAVQHSALAGDLIHFIECKRYQASRKVGIGVVQRLLGTVAQRHATKGIVVTTSSFSRDAIQAAADTRHVMTLNDYETVVGWLRSLGGVP